MAAWQILTDFDRQPMQRMHSVCMPKVSKDFSVCVHKWLCHDQLIRRIRSYLTRQWLLPIHICLKWNEKIMKSKWGAIKYLKPLNHLLHHQFHSISERLVSSTWPSLHGSKRAGNRCNMVQWHGMTWNDCDNCRFRKVASTCCTCYVDLWKIGNEPDQHWPTLKLLQA